MNFVLQAPHRINERSLACSIAPRGDEPAENAVLFGWQCDRHDRNGFRQENRTLTRIVNQTAKARGPSLLRRSATKRLDRIGDGITPPGDFETPHPAKVFCQGLSVFFLWTQHAHPTGRDHNVVFLTGGQWRGFCDLRRKDDMGRMNPTGRPCPKATRSDGTSCRSSFDGCASGA